MTYKINGTEILQPTEGRWLEREPLNINGHGHAVYPGVREFELRFVLSTPADYSQLLGYFNAVGSTGTVVVDLPKYGNPTYTFFSYSGCVLREPTAGVYFAENHLDMILLVTNIRT